MDAIRRLCLAAFLAACSRSALGGDAAAPPNPRLAALPENAWLDLKPEGMAKARMYSGACFGGGLLWYFGGAHRSYPGNDVQLLDPRASRWIQATEPEMPPRDSPAWKTLTGGGGNSAALTPKGRPFTEHTYQQVCWEPERRRFFIVLVSSGTWEFDPEARRWEHLTNRLEDPKADPRGSWAQNHTLYEPALKAPVLVVGSGGEAAIWRFDHDARRWQRLGPTPDALKWNEFYSACVPEWKAHLISTMKSGFYRFDAPARTLAAIESPEALARCQSLAYDAAAHAVVALAVRKVDQYCQTVVPWVLDLETLKWQEMAPQGPAPVGQTTGAWATFWYDPDLNVHLLVNCVRRDRAELFDGGVTEAWAYRLRGVPPADKAGDKAAEHP